jgi:soluble lytic murein transglycosylase
VSRGRGVPAGLSVAVLAVGFLAGAVGVRLAAAGKTPGSLLHRAPPDLSKYAEEIERVAAESRLDPHLLRGLVAAESGGNPRAVSGKDAVGLLQLTVETAAREAKELGLPRPDAEALLDPATNLRLGARYLARLLARFGGEEAFALAAYNAGPTPVARWRARAADVSALDAVMREGYAETRNLVTRSLRFRDEYAGR